MVSAHVVAGTNIFSDIAASWRDVFGGQSKSYKKQLEQINDGVVGDLREEASQRGANALVGLQIDHDQVSGHNKEMFMVTASATAVCAQMLSEPGPDAQEGNAAVTAREVGVEERIVKLMNESQNGTLTLNEDRWRFLIENQVSDLAGAVQSALTEVLGSPGGATQRQEHHLNSGRDYFLSIPENTAKECLYEMTSHDKERVVDWAIGVLEDGNLLDLDRIESMLNGDFHDEQKPALEILTTVDKPYYEQGDIDRLKALRSKVENGFGERGEVLEVEDGGMLSSGTKEVWEIKDGAHNPIGQEYCKETGLDIYGFRRRDTRPEDAIEVLETKTSALTRRFGDG